MKCHMCGSELIPSCVQVNTKRRQKEWGASSPHPLAAARLIWRCGGGHVVHMASRHKRLALGPTRMRVAESRVSREMRGAGESFPRSFPLL